MITEFQGEWRFLSNFWPVPGGVVLDGSKVRFETVEHAYQAAKSTDLKVWHAVAKLRTPGQAKRYGRCILVRHDWAHVKLAIMYRLLLQKFSVEPLKGLLSATQGQKLIEGNRWGDTFWGVCGGIGTNYLGKLLMQVRDEVHDGTL